MFKTAGGRAGAYRCMGSATLELSARKQKSATLRLQLSNMLKSYLADIDRQAEEMFEHLIKQMAERGGVTEHFKAADQMEWVRRINNIRNQATEIVNSEIIYI